MLVQSSHVFVSVAGYDLKQGSFTVLVMLGLILLFNFLFLRVFDELQSGQFMIWLPFHYFSTAVLYSTDASCTSCVPSFDESTCWLSSTFLKKRLADFLFR